jgi:hypothetical protein
VEDAVEENLGAIECESGKMEVQRNNIKKCLLDTMSDWVGKVETKVRTPWITQEMITKIDEYRKWKNVNNEGRSTEDRN